MRRRGEERLYFRKAWFCNFLIIQIAISVPNVTIEATELNPDTYFCRQLTYFSMT